MKDYKTISRELAFKTLYAWDIKGGEPINIFEDVLNVSESKPKKDAKKYAQNIINTFSNNIENIDKEISSRLENWTLETIGEIEKALLRTAFTEFLYLKPKKSIQAIIDYLDIANKYSNKNTASFINGVLSPLIKDEPI